MARRKAANPDDTVTVAGLKSLYIWLQDPSARVDDIRFTGDLKLADTGSSTEDTDNQNSEENGGDSSTETTHQPPSGKPRVLISTDAGGQDPDDLQSLAHYFLYANLFETVGIISSPPSPIDNADPVGELGEISGVGNPYYQRNAQAIRNTIDAYAYDYNQYLNQSSDYPTPEALRSVVRQGATTAGWPSEIPTSEGAQLIIDAAKASDEPLYVLIWGGATDVAKALYEAPEIKSKLRIYFVAIWNSWANQGLLDSRNYLYNTQSLSDLWMIETHSSHWGQMQYEGFVDQNVQWLNDKAKGHGALGELYYLAGQKIYEIEATSGRFSSAGIRMGDTASVLWLASSLVGETGHLVDPSVASWGGQFYQPDPNKRPHYWTDKREDTHRYQVNADASWAQAQIGGRSYQKSTQAATGIDDASTLLSDLQSRYQDNAYGVQTIQRWRNTFMADFANRLDLAQGTSTDFESIKGHYTGTGGSTQGQGGGSTGSGTGSTGDNTGTDTEGGQGTGDEEGAEAEDEDEQADQSPIDRVIYYHPGALGSPIAAIASDKSIVNNRLCWEEVYLPYGQQLSAHTDQEKSTRSELTQACGTAKPARGYTGHVQDASGLVYAQQRYYDPEIGRFLSVDPVGANPHDPRLFGRYHYGANNPYYYTDPTGMIFWAVTPEEAAIWTAAIVEPTPAGEAAALSYSIGKRALLGLGVIKAGQMLSESSTNNDEIDFDPKKENHNWGNREGHIENTPENREKIKNVVNNPNNKRGKDKWGNSGHSYIDKNGDQVWAGTRDGKITEWGVNKKGSHRTWNSETGFKAKEKPKQNKK